MKQPKNKPRPAKSKRKQPSGNVPVKKDRRSFMSRAGKIGVAAVLLGGLGFWGVETVQAAVAERDLTVVGQGAPTVVQVHDTQCQTCIALQREVRAALKDMDHDALEYRVADLKSDNGLAFASQYGASHSTLLFFDGAGNLTNRLVGANDRTTLAQLFAGHIAR